MLFLLRFIWTFNKFDDVFLLTGGAAGTQVITVQIMDWLRGRGDVGAASMLSLILAAILVVLVAVYFVFFFRRARRTDGRPRADPHPVGEQDPRVLKWASVAFFLIITAFPLIYIVSLSFKPISELIQEPGRFWPTWGQVREFDAYKQVLRPQSEGGQGFTTFIKNSLIVSVVTVALTLGIGTLAAYAAARMNFFGKRTISFGIIIVYLFPAIVLAIPLFALLSNIGIRGSLFSLMLVYLARRSRSRSTCCATISRRSRSSSRRPG